MTEWLSDLVIPSWIKSALIYVLIAGLLFWVVYAIYEFGVSNEHTRGLAQSNAELAKLSQRNAELIAYTRNLEQANVNNTNNLTIEYEKRIADEKINTSNLMRRVDAGTLQLRIATKAQPSCNSDSAASGTAASGATETSAELSPEADKFLIGFSDECDATAEKLNLAIDIAEADRKQAPDIPLNNEALPHE